MNRLLLLLFLAYSLNGFCQNHSSTTTVIGYSKVEKMPQYPAGNDALYKLFLDSVDYPPVRYGDLDDSDLSGKVVMKMIIDEKGNVEDVTITKSDNAKLNPKFLALARRLKFIPGTNEGKAVKVTYILPINYNFQLR
jgi:TonB family protein